MQNTFFRFEFKYPVPYSLIPSIESDFMNMGFEKDSPSLLDGFYYVSSIYFDTPTLSDYSDKAGGFLNRKKVRARIYGQEIQQINPDSPTIWLEIKEKHDMMIHKRRVAITPAEWAGLLESRNFAYDKILSRLKNPEDSIFSEFVYLIACETRKPYVVVQYKRRAMHYYSEKKPVRVTLDYDIRAEKNSSFCKTPSEDVSHDMAIIELKFKGALPWPVKFVIDKYNLRRDAYSKYAHSVDTVRRLYPISR